MLAPYRTPEAPRLSITGPAILLPSHAVLPLSMVLHEMATNAAKYGALSTRRGRIGIAWRVIGDIETSVELVWQEQGGPSVKAPTSDGFGTRLIHLVIGHDLDGRSRADFDSTGVRWTIAFPVRSPALVGGATVGSAKA